MGGDWSENIAAMKSITHRLAKVPISGDLASLFSRIGTEDHTQQAVIGRDESMTGRFRQNRPPGTPHSGIYYRNVYRPFRKTMPGLSQRVGGFRNRVGRDLVRDIDDLRLRTNPQDHALHRGDVVVNRTEVR